MDIDDAVARVTADPQRTALLFDFDGSLAPIVPDPTTSALADGLADTIDQLVDAYAIVAVISGRPVEFLASRIHAEGVHLHGLYGLQTFTAGITRLHPDVEAWLPAVDTARARMQDEVRAHDGLMLEDKVISLAIHWRTAPDVVAAEQHATAIAGGVAEATGLKVEPGKFVLELRPPVNHDKGDAVRELLVGHDLQTCLYVGDDLGDLPAFAAVGSSGIRMLVEHGHETHADLRAAVDVTVPGVQGAAELLKRIATDTRNRAG